MALQPLEAAEVGRPETALEPATGHSLASPRGSIGWGRRVMASSCVLFLLLSFFWLCSKGNRPLMEALRQRTL